MDPRAAEFSRGLRAVFPLIVGAVPFAIIYGVLAVNAGIPLLLAQAISLLVFAGSAQFLAAQLAGAGASGLVIVVTTFVVNLRHALYSASISPHLRELPTAWKWLLAYLLTDEAYAIAITRYREATRKDWAHWYFLGAALSLWASWQAGTAVGILLGTEVPASWSLDFALALTFIALVVPALRTRADLVAALVGGLVAVLLAGLPYKAGLIIAALSGIGAGLAAWRLSR